MQMIFPEQVKLLNSDFDNFKFERDFFLTFWMKRIVKYLS